MELAPEHTHLLRRGIEDLHRELEAQRAVARGEGQRRVLHFLLTGCKDAARRLDHAEGSDGRSVAVREVERFLATAKTHLRKMGRDDD